MLNSVCQLELALADWLRGWLDDAERGFAASIAGWRVAGERGLAAAVCNLLGYVQFAQGRLDAVLATYQMALEITAPPGKPALPAAGIAYAGMAKVEYQRGEHEAACAMPLRGSRGSGRSTTPRRSPLAWRPWRGSGRPPVIQPGRSTRLVRPGGSHPASPLQTFPILCRRSGRGCC